MLKKYYYFYTQDLFSPEAFAELAKQTEKVKNIF
jgi:hypothetical protein